MAMWPFASNQPVLDSIAALNRQLVSGFNAVNKRLDSIIVSQASIDNAVSTVTDLLTDLGNQNATMLTDIQELQTALANGTPVTTTALDAIVAHVAAVKTGIDDAVGQLTTTANPPATPPAT